MTVVEIDLGESLPVVVTAGEAKPCRYVVVHEGDAVTSYETSADPRTAGGRIGLRNVVCRHVPELEKAVVADRLADGIDARGRTGRGVGAPVRRTTGEHRAAGVEW